MYHVEGFILAVGPFAFDVINVEFQIRRYPGRLDGAEIGPDDFGFGMFVCEVDGPDAFGMLVMIVCCHMTRPHQVTSPSPEVEHSLDLSLGQLPVQQGTILSEPPDVVDQIEPRLLGLVIRQVVCALAVGVVSAAVLVLVASDGGGNGCAASRPRLGAKCGIGCFSCQLPYYVSAMRINRLG